MKSLRRFAAAVSIGWSLCFMLAFSSSSALAGEAERRAFDIPGGDAFAALKQFSAQTDLSLLSLDF